MARPKKQVKTKEPVRIRMREITGGNRSLYLDIYVNGVRSYEGLKLYLIPETDQAAKIRNANTMQAANAIKAARILELTNRKAGIKTADKAGKITVGELFRAYVEKRKQTSLHASEKARQFLAHLDRWGLSSCRLSQVDKNFCLDVLRHIKESGLKQSTQNHFQVRFAAVLNDAVRNDLIPVNPMTKVDPGDRIKPAESTREYLTVDEVRALIVTPYGKEIEKRAFLFSCFCGLRYSDVVALRWGDIRRSTSGGVEVCLTMQKTKRPIVLPLSDDALKWLPARRSAAGTERVFKGIDRHIVDRLKVWAAAAGIKKNVTFHTARHTFATMLITFGADLYTVSKLLGHSNITMTQVYAKLVDAKKIEAVNLFNGKF